MEQQNLKKKIKTVKKRYKNIKRKEELPSFLEDVSNEEFERKQKTHKGLVYSSPVFFGECKQFHPIFHPVVLGGHSPPIHTGISDESLKSDLFVSKHELRPKPPILRKLQPPKRGAVVSTDSTSHHSPGVRRVYIREISVFTPDFGQTISEIEGETCREIPYRRLKSTISGISEVESENVMLSDIKEKKRDLLPYEQRMAHNHFPKEFVTVKLLGPVIPASITITKIPSKRKTLSDFNFEIKKKTQEPIKRTATSKENQEVQNKKKSETKMTSEKKETVLEVKEEIMENEEELDEISKEEKPESRDGSERESGSIPFDDMVIDEEDEEGISDEEGMADDEGETAEDDKGE